MNKEKSGVIPTRYKRKIDLSHIDLKKKTCELFIRKMDYKILFLYDKTHDGLRKGAKHLTRTGGVRFDYAFCTLASLRGALIFS